MRHGTSTAVPLSPTPIRASSTVANARSARLPIFWPHGVQKMLGFPQPRPAPEFLSQLWFAGMLELVLAPLLIVGFLTRPVAFILAGEMAFAYWLGHAPRGFY